MMRAIGLGVAALLMALTQFQVECAEPCDPDLIPEARAVLDYLESAYGKKTLVGKQGGGKAEAAFESSGRWPAMLGSEQSHKPSHACRPSQSHPSPKLTRR